MLSARGGANAAGARAAPPGLPGVSAGTGPGSSAPTEAGGKARSRATGHRATLRARRAGLPLRLARARRTRPGDGSGPGVPTAGGSGLPTRPAAPLVPVPERARMECFRQALERLRDTGPGAVEERVAVAEEHAPLAHRAQRRPARVFGERGQLGTRARQIEATGRDPDRVRV